MSIPNQLPDLSKQNSSLINIKSYTFLAVALATIAVLGGVFLLLASYKTLPHGINAISQLGLGGQLAGYGIGGLGIVVILLACVIKNLKNQSPAKDPLPSVSSTSTRLEPVKTEALVTKKNDLSVSAWIVRDMTGIIRLDKTFEYSKRITKENGVPLEVKEKDFYVHLDLSSPDEEKLRTWVQKLKPKLKKVPIDWMETDLPDSSSSKDVPFCKKNEHVLFNLFLPSSLFEEVKSGQTIRFHYDGKPVQLTCLSSSDALSFEAEFDLLKKTNLIKGEILFSQDVEGIKCFKCIEVPDDLVRVNSENNTPQKSITDFNFYEDDQVKFGPYSEMPILDFSEGLGAITFNVHKRMEISDIHLISSLKTKKLWIFIPHCPEKNKPSNPVGTPSSWTHFANGKKEEFTIETFDPSKGHRMATYSHGQYCTLNFTSFENLTLSFNSKELLTLNFPPIKKT